MVEIALSLTFLITLLDMKLPDVVESNNDRQGGEIMGIIMFLTGRKHLLVVWGCGDAR